MTRLFYRNWDAYKTGLVTTGIWLGNENFYYLTNQRNYKLRFDITTSDGSAKYAEYTEFQIESESNKYRMNKLGSRSGNTAGRSRTLFQHLLTDSKNGFLTTEAVTLTNWTTDTDCLSKSSKGVHIPLQPFTPSSKIIMHFFVSNILEIVISCLI
ncbi:tenascin [Apostichopus japonicus]|uniref:Tenascin n=1 Tax=Stichopus japonicus TaxID=307972 RepID=A0A2G8K473_STIJA|nr:tenascin [Apostichopus japonicus]